MSKWTGQGDASSIPSDLKKPLLFCNFIDNIHASIGDLASSFIGAMQVFLDQNEDNPEANPCENNDEWLGICKTGKTCQRESLVEILQRQVESYLQKNKASKSSFKASQVRDAVSFLNPIVIVSACSLSLSTLMCW